MFFMGLNPITLIISFDEPNKEEHRKKIPRRWFFFASFLLSTQKK
jgi:hypothetical protein